jgi:hypothetical protein
MMVMSIWPDDIALALTPTLSQGGRGSKRLRLILQIPFLGEVGDEGKCNISIILSRLKFLPILRIFLITTDFISKARMVGCC